jgi:tetratricopeptide (TPR) repeat protein
VIEILSRVAHLFALLFAPRLLSPDPPSGAIDFAILGVVILLAGPAIGVFLVRQWDVLEAKVALGLWLCADIALVATAMGTSSRGSPLLSGYYVAAPFVWSAVAASAATLAGQYLGVSFKNKRMGGAIITLAIGIFIFRDASALLSSTTDQWSAALATDPDHERALFALGDKLSPASLDACIKRRPSACVCRVPRAERALDAERGAAALEELGQASCSGHRFEARASAALSLGLAMTNRGPEAAEAAQKALAASPGDWRALFATALAASQRQDVDTAIDFAKRASEHSTARGPLLLVSQLSIGKGDLGGAHAALAKLLEQHPDDPDAVYNLAVLSDREGNYNKAREGYLKALKLRPAMANARYNLALLTLRNGFTDEARNHVRRFVEAFPEDPRRAGLEARLPP